MKRGKVKGFSRFFTLPKVAVTLLVSAGIICLLNNIVSAGHSEVPGTLVLLNRTARADVTRLASSRDELNEAQTAPKYETVQMRVTAYCPCSKCCGQYSDGQTANGHKIRPGDTFVAADGRYTFGTQMLVPGYSSSQPVKVLDRGGAIRGERLDVFFHTHQEALNWGVQYLQVRVYHNSPSS
ncbi:MAG: 3D domain-containing protein [Planctomycetota bacterium]